MPSGKPDINPRDPNQRIPTAVIAANASADELHAQVYGAADTPPAGGATPPAGDPPAPAPETPAPAPPLPPPAPVAANAPPADWERQWNGLLGRLRKSDETIAALRAELAERTAAPPPTQQVSQKLVTEAEEREFGVDFLTVVAKRARDEVSGDMARMASELEALRGQVGKVNSSVKQRTEHEFYSYLDTQMPDWREQNVDQDFINWLHLQDPYTGSIRSNLLNEAVEKFEAERALAFFKGFRSEQAAKSPASFQPSLAPPPGLQPAGDTGKLPLENLAAPGRAASAPGSVPAAEKPIITTGQIAEFYAENRRGKYTPEEARRYEEMIFEATKEGRIRQQ